MGLTLPDWTHEGLLPPGAHRTDFPGIYERLVEKEQNRDRREILFRAFRLHFELMRELIPHGTAWVDGGFCMQKEQPPRDVDVVYFPSDWDALRAGGEDAREQLMGLMTLQDVIVGQPGPSAIARIQPIGGTLDAFIQPSTPDVSQYWFTLWSSVKVDGIVNPDLEKGFVEVTW